MMTMINLFASTFNLTPAEAASILVKVNGSNLVSVIRNQDHATCLWLDQGKGHVVDVKALQTFLEGTCGGAKSADHPRGVSPSAASFRVSRQRNPDKYGVKPEYRTSYEVVSAGRSGRVTSIQGEDAAQIMELLGRAPVAEAAK